MQNLTATQTNRLRNLAARINDATTTKAEDKAIDQMNRYQERLIASGACPEAIITVIHGCPAPT